LRQLVLPSLVDAVPHNRSKLLFGCGRSRSWPSIKTTLAAHPHVSDQRIWSTLADGGSDSSYACPLGRSLPRVGPSASFQMPDDLFEQSLRRGNLIQLRSSLSARVGDIREIVRFNVLAPHHPEEMLSMLVIVLRLHGIAAQAGCLCKRHIALVLSSGILQDITGSTSGYLG
jgi:hypothetical protein